MNQRIIRLATSGVLIALGTILSFVKLWDMPFGGSITLFSLLPLAVLAYKYGIKWGMLCSFIFALLQTILGAATSPAAFFAVNGMSLVLMCFLDYILAFFVLGFTGMLKNKLKNQTLAFSLGILITGLLRLACHFLSGVILWGTYAESFFEGLGNSFGDSILANFSGTQIVMLYSILYNSFMIPEIIITIIGAVVVMAIKPLRKEITSKNAAMNI